MSVHITSCVCCSLLTGCVFTGLFSMLLYFLAFSLEAWWIIDAKVQLPLAAYLLALIYFFLSVLSLSTLVGLRAKRTRLLLAWILFFLLCVFPEAGMVLYMAVYYWIIGTVSIHSLYSYWRDEKSVLRSLQELNATKGGFHPLGITGEYQQRPGSSFGFVNEGFNDAMAITKYAPQPHSKKALNRLSLLEAANGFGGLAPQQFSHMPLSDQMSALVAADFRANEFDPSKFALSQHLASGGGRRRRVNPRSVSQWDLPSGYDHMDAAIYEQRPGRPYSRGSALQWYRPRSLVNLHNSATASRSSSGVFNPTFNSLDRRGFGRDSCQGLLRPARSLGALDFSGDEASSILRGGIGAFAFDGTHQQLQQQRDSRISLWSDHADKYRDVAL